MANLHPYNHPDYKKFRRQLRASYRNPTEYIACVLNLPGCTGQAEVPDHIVPISKGGGWTAKNLQPACAYCNRSKGSGRNRRTTDLHRIRTERFPNDYRRR